jgi:hypothetical protein
MPEIISYDLTTPKGMAEAVANFAKENPAKAVIAILNPLGFLGLEFGEKIFKSVLEPFEHPEKMIDAQRQAAVDLIKAGKEHGASKISVTLDQKAGIDIGSELKDFPLKFSVGSDCKMKIDVEYK